MLLLVLSIAAGACSHSSEARRHGEPEVVLVTRAGEEHVKVEVARSDPEREHGLMYRQKLDAGRGMIFLFEAPQQLKFWMKNTYIPLDMIFIGADKHVVYVEENAEPLTLQTRGPDEDTQFVLEVPGGWSRAHGVERGVVVKFVDID
ncbi:MAG TPA: DUF192 domain-containing protein [Polyangia bacterium]|jgi:hypothetical protein